MRTEAETEPGKGQASRGKRGSCIPEVRRRPLRALFMLLNQSEPSPYGQQRIAAHAEQSVRVIQLGLGAIGHLLAQSAVQVEERTVPSECVESLGTLMAELSDLAALCHQLCTEPAVAPGKATVLHEGGGS